MLNHIHVRNFAIVEKLDLDMQAGLTVLTGETGAGKSILLDALGLTLGDRAESSLVRKGAERAEVSISFELGNVPAAIDWLKARELDADSECIIRRTINRDGPSKAYINGQPCTVQALRELGEMLVDLHGQHEHQSLLKKSAQMELLDAYAENGPFLDELQTVYKSWRDIRDQLEALEHAGQERTSRLEFLEFQVKELDALGLKENEIAELEHEHRRLANSHELVNGSQELINLLEENEPFSIRSGLADALSLLNRLAATDADLEVHSRLLDEAGIQVQEVSGAIKSYLDRLDIDPTRLAEVEERLADIHRLSRKHHVPANDLPDLLERMQKEKDELEHSDIQLEKLQSEVLRLETQYVKIAEKLSKRRRKAAGELSQAVTDSMQELGLQGGVFKIEVNSKSEARFSPTGTDQIEFLVSANPGQDPGPLAKIASGGELSRISLALQVVAVKGMFIPTLVFDEVDVGIGGRVAEIVGRQLRELSRNRQVICVTHLPQVAALGDHHLQVNKSTLGDSTTTGIRALGKDERVEEIARMLGGVEITAQTTSHAREMIERAEAAGSN